MKPLIEELIRILKKEFRLFEDLHAIIIDEKEAFEHLETESIMKNANQKETLALKIKALEESRIALLKRIGDFMKTDDVQNLTVSKIAQSIDEPTRETLLSIAKNLKKTAKEIKKLNSKNKMIAEYTLGFIDFLISQLQYSVVGEKFYYVRDKLKAYNSAGNLIRQKI